MLFSFTYNYLFNVKKETPLSLKIKIINNKSLRTSPLGHSGRGGWGRGKEGELATMSLEFEYLH